MKNLIVILLLSCSAFAQKQVFNVQHYCVDEMPTAKSECDISGNEYSFVFLDEKKKEVVFFLTEVKFVYAITGTEQVGGNTIYKLTNDAIVSEMKINKQRNKIEFSQPNRHILLTVGKSTKSL